VPFSTKQLLLVAGIVLLIMFCFGYTGRLIASSELRAEVAYWEQEVAVERERLAETQAMAEYVKTDDFVRERARIDLGWTLPDEIAIWVVGEESPVVSAPPVVVEQVPSWQLWRQRFFGP
jgi:cell division protein FtsB